MAERPLQEVLADPPSSQMVPVWAWGCGAGCLLMVLLAIAGTWYIVKVAEREFGPEAAWPMVQEVLPFDERPDGYSTFLIPFKGITGFVSRRMGMGEEELAPVADLDVVMLVHPRGDLMANIMVGRVPEGFEDGGREAGVREEFELQDAW
jgi:hypothetical protein